MTSLQALILGIIQGITEFLPVSSSGHLVIFQKIFSLDTPPIFFDTTVHLATLAAIVIYFKNAIIKLKPQAFFLIVIGTIPTGIIGLILNPYKGTIFDSTLIVAIGLIITSLFLLSTQLKPWLKTTSQPTPFKAFIIGTIQGLAIFPGISRSGSTIATGLRAGINRSQAFVFSFLLSIPAIIAAELLQLIDGPQLQDIALMPLVIGAAAAFTSGFVSLKLLQKVLKSHKLYFFAFYTFPLGLALLVQFFAS